MDERLSQEQQRWLEACVRDINEGDNLFRLFESLKPIMANRMRKYLRDIPYYDKEDYYQTGLITLWDNVERVKKDTEIAEKFLSYYAVSVEHAYARIFYNFVMKNDPVVEVSADYGNGYNIVEVRSFQAYRDKVARRKKEYYETHREQHAEHNRKRREKEKEEKRIRKRKCENSKRYYERHRDEVNRKRRERRAENHDEICRKEREYYAAHKDKFTKTRKINERRNAERIREQNRIYNLSKKEIRKEKRRIYDAENRERITASHRKYYQEHKEEINAKRRENYAKKNGTYVKPPKPILSEAEKLEKKRKAKRESDKRYYYRNREEILAKRKIDREKKKADHVSDHTSEKMTEID